MATKPKQPPGAPLTLGNVRALAVQTLPQRVVVSLAVAGNGLLDSAPGRELADHASIAVALA
jgi:hypothetical protein